MRLMIDKVRCVVVSLYVGGGDCEAQTVAGSDDVGSVPESHVGWVHASRGEEFGLQPSVSPPHTHGVVLNQSSLASGVHVLDAHLHHAHTQTPTERDIHTQQKNNARARK